MSEGNGSSVRNSCNTRNVNEPRERLKEKNDEPKAEQVDRFRNILQTKTQRDNGRLSGPPKEPQVLDGNPMSQEGVSSGERSDTATDMAVVRRGDSNERQQGREEQNDGLRPAELVALYQAQLAVREPVAFHQGAVAVSQSNPQKLADILERHVRQLAVEAKQDPGDRGAILLRLRDDVLPGTDLILQKTDNGWKLKVATRTRASYDAIELATPKLAERFLNRDLGELVVERDYIG